MTLCGVLICCRVVSISCQHVVSEDALNAAAVQKHQKALSHSGCTGSTNCFRGTQCPCEVFCDVWTQKPETGDSPHGVQSQIIMTLNTEHKITSCLYAHSSPLDDPSCVFFKCNEAVMINTHMCTENKGLKNSMMELLPQVRVWRSSRVQSSSVTSAVCKRSVLSNVVWSRYSDG